MDDQVEGDDRRRRVEQAPYQEDRRENQRLGIGDAGVAAVMILIPEWHAPEWIDEARNRKNA